jgi:hypothetical protein
MTIKIATSVGAANAAIVKKKTTLAALKIQMEAATIASEKHRITLQMEAVQTQILTQKKMIAKTVTNQWVLALTAGYVLMQNSSPVTRGFGIAVTGLAGALVAVKVAAGATAQALTMKKAVLIGGVAGVAVGAAALVTLRRQMRASTAATNESTAALNMNAGAIGAHLDSTNSAYESYRRTQDQIRSQVRDWDTNAVAMRHHRDELQRHIAAYDGSHQARERLNHTLREMEKMLPGITRFVFDETGALSQQIGTVDSLAESYIRLARAKAQSQAAENLMTAAFETQFAAETELSELGGRTGSWAMRNELANLQRLKSEQEERHRVTQSRYEFMRDERIRNGRITQQQVNAARNQMFAEAGRIGQHNERIAELNEMLARRGDLEQTRDAAIADAQRYDDLMMRLQNEIADARAPLDRDLRGWDNPGGLGSSASRPLHTVVDNKVSIREEDLRLLNDMNINRIRVAYQTVQPSLHVHIDTINETTDVHEVIQILADGIEEMTQSDLRQVPA